MTVLSIFTMQASGGWTRQFMLRHSLVVRCRTLMAQELPATLEERIAAFHRQLKRVKEINCFRVIGNMHETPLYFDVPSRVIAKKGTKSVIVRTTGSEKRHLTDNHIEHYFRWRRSSRSGSHIERYFRWRCSSLSSSLQKGNAHSTYKKRRFYLSPRESLDR